MFEERFRADYHRSRWPQRPNFDVIAERAWWQKRHDELALKSAATPAIQTVKVAHQLGGQAEVLPIRTVLPLINPVELPANWHGPACPAIDGAYWTYEPPFGRRLKVLASAAREADRKIWLHISVSKWHGRNQELPNWEDLRLVKDLFIGRSREAYMVFPVAVKHVNLGEVHHLWCCLEGNVLPDFSHRTGSI